ncbi:hypothetical protein EBZ80_22900 [bacterium]|nr:hypothetical protein [bacterium]
MFMYAQVPSMDVHAEVMEIANEMARQIAIGYCSTLKQLERIVGRPCVRHSVQSLLHQDDEAFARTFANAVHAAIEKVAVPELGDHEWNRQVAELIGPTIVTAVRAILRAEYA